MLSTKIKYKWSEHEQKAFDAIKPHVSRQTLLTYPDFAMPFDIHMDASNVQPGVIISQAGKPIAYYLQTTKFSAAIHDYQKGILFHH